MRFWLAGNWDAAEVVDVDVKDIHEAANRIMAFVFPVTGRSIVQHGPAC